MLLQQCLPFTVLKLSPKMLEDSGDDEVATVLTVYGIETTIYILPPHMARMRLLQQCLPFTVLKPSVIANRRPSGLPVATVLTVYGIETRLL